MNKKCFVNQKSINDCGAACLAMILKLNNIKVSLDEIKRELKISKEGVSAYEIIKYSKSKGLDAVGYKNIGLCDLKAPCIIHTVNENNIQHFVVFLKEYKNKVLIADPASKIMYVSKEDLEKKYTRIAILFEEKFSLLKTIIKNKKIITRLVLLSVLLIIISIIFSSFLSIIINLKLKKQILFVLFVCFCLIALIKNLLSYIKNKFLISFQLCIDNDITIPTIEKLINLPQNFYYDKGSGELVSKVNDLYYIKTALYNFISNVIINTLFLIFCLAILFCISNKLLFINILFIIFLLISNKKFFDRNLSKTYDMQIANEMVNNKLTDVFSLIYIVKNLCKESFFCNKIKESYNNLLSKFKCISNIYNKKDLKDNIIFDIYSLSVMLLLITNTNDFSLILFAISIENIVIDIIKQTIKDLPMYLDFKSYYIRIIDILKLKSINESSSYIDIKHIHIKNLNYKYEDKLVLKDINLKINKGDWVMINGPSGTGKSTLVKFLSKDIYPMDNKIFINKKCINKYEIQVIKNSFLHIKQNARLFNTSIKENIFFSGNIDKNILKVCLIDKLLNEKNITLDYLVDNKSLNLSGGEASKILIAQALNLNKDFLLLDETTNNLDTKTEYAILKNIKKKYKNISIILITHRKDNSCLFNKIYTLENGRLIKK